MITVKRFHVTHAALLAVILVPSISARAGWEVINLHPAGSTESYAHDVFGGQQVGAATIGGEMHASLWYGTAASWVDLHPAGSIASEAMGTDGAQHAGYALLPDDDYFEVQHASLWTSTAASWVDINPAGYTESHANGVSGGQQTGWAWLDYHLFSLAGAGLWSGTVNSWVDLYPVYSEAYGISDGQQVGWAFVDTNWPAHQHAGLWSESGEWVDLHPAAFDRSVAYGISDGQQVGWAGYQGGDWGSYNYDHAGMWSGSKASWQSLHPLGSQWGNSQAFDVSDGYQAGIVFNSSRSPHASLWMGTPESWIDLHNFLPAGYSNSRAEGVDVSGNDIWIVGQAFNSAADRIEAVMWHTVVPEPSSLVVLGGGIVGLAMVRRRRQRVAWVDGVDGPPSTRPPDINNFNKRDKPLVAGTMTGFHRTRAAFLALILAALLVGAGRADIFQWEYINPADPSQGKQQSATLCPDGAGVIAEANADLSNRNLTMAFLENAQLPGAMLTNADLSQSNLANVYFKSAELTNADFTGAVVRGATFMEATGFTAAQLYSTASHQAGDLSGIRFYGCELSGWNFAGQNLANAYFNGATLTDADLSQANLANADFAGATLTSANLTGADVQQADFWATTSRGFTAAQLYSTASYQARDLSGIGLRGNDLTGWNFAAHNLANADFRSATLTDADFTGADVRSSNFDQTTSRGFTAAQLYSTASYQNRDLSGMGLGNNNLTGWNFAGQNLAHVIFEYATLTSADFTGADVRGAFFWFPTGFTAAQLYSTASYHARDLSGIQLNAMDLTGWNFAGQNLANAHFYYATLTNADLRGADLRRAALDWSTAIVGNAILPDGHVEGVELAAGQTLLVRDYYDNPELGQYDTPIPIHVEDRFVMGPGGVLQMLFDADPWGSTISFDAGIPVTIAGGTLDLQLAPGVVPASQIGRTFQVFDWTGVLAIGEFSIVSPYVWDISRLYSAGEITFVAVPELSSLTLLALGISSLLLRRLR